LKNCISSCLIWLNYVVDVLWAREVDRSCSGVVAAMGPADK
jgi:hypothetical protein